MELLLPVEQRQTGIISHKIEELGLSPDTVLRQAGLPIGLFNQDKIQMSTEVLRALPRDFGSQRPSGLWPEPGDGGTYRAYDPIKIAALSARSFRAQYSDQHATNQD